MTFDAIFFLGSNVVERDRKSINYSCARRLNDNRKKLLSLNKLGRYVDGISIKMRILCSRYTRTLGPFYFIIVFSSSPSYAIFEYFLNIYENRTSTKLSQSFHIEGEIKKTSDRKSVSVMLGLAQPHHGQTFAKQRSICSS